MVLITGSGWGGLESVTFRFRFTHSRSREFADINLVDELVLFLPHICYSTEESIVIATYIQSMLFFTCSKCIFWGSLNPNIYVVGFRKCRCVGNSICTWPTLSFLPQNLVWKHSHQRCILGQRVGTKSYV